MAPSGRLVRRSRRGGWAILTAILVGIVSAIALPVPAPVAAETAPKVAVIVGPVGSSHRQLP